MRSRWELWMRFWIGGESRLSRIKKSRLCKIEMLKSCCFERAYEAQARHCNGDNWVVVSSTGGDVKMWSCRKCSEALNWTSNVQQ